MESIDNAPQKIVSVKAYANNATDTGQI